MLISSSQSGDVVAPPTREAAQVRTSLVEANRLLVLAEEMAHVGHWQFDQISGLGYFSDEARRIFGFAEDLKITREPVLMAYHPEDRARVLALLADHVAAGTRFEYPAKIVQPSGEVRVLLVRGRCDRNAAGTSVVTFGTVLDVTEIRRTEQRLQETSTLLTNTLNTMDQGLLMVDADGIVQVCNARAIELLELPAALMQSNPSFSTVVRYQQEQDDFRKSDPGFQRWVASGGLESRPQTYERERPNGTVLEIRTVPLPDGSAVRTFTDITERKQNERRIAHMARHDALTDLPNRTLFHECLNQRLDDMRWRGGGCAVLFLDLDRFKAVNDTLGHLAGDVLLREMAGRLNQVVQIGDLVARLGGDEFAVLVSEVDRVEAVSDLAARLVAAVRVPTLIGAQSVEVGVSVGIALSPEHGTDGETVFRRADLALYQAKADGRGTFRIFEFGFDDRAAERLSLESDLRHAISSETLALHYQPQARSDTGEIVGFEVLARWTHPTRGPIAPATFIGLAEETGLILPLGELVLRAACREAAGWVRPLKIAVNLSPRQFSQTDLPERILAILAETGLSPARLELEVTETVIINDLSRALATLCRLKAMGIRISMDDFGTGYSSLATLQAFPFDKIKIDRSFVSSMDANPQSKAIVRAVLGLGRSLKMGVVAEGVETAAQLRFLSKAGCDEVQGYFIGRPQPIENFADLIHEIDKI
ncbi:EAL domain-containing protein [Methylobacterium sp. WL64]|uniref:putative bifunctional diguanylate cyclase/phosphodiesterase n=1 Tax=Methylobacterium sp. WL64 TaxID=2603894 RepID=UPI0011C72A51|nr:EAL domain-containing protein [Methylobacterium sp. WL64]TXN01106.1 EAL domain-containing protein [Methylobacterium sp. WL64]